MSELPDVFFLVIDSVRQDRMSTYGHDRETSPTVDGLAEAATVYTEAYTPAPWTLPSHCSVFTGRHPSAHGVTNGFADSTNTLPEDVRTLTEDLADEGYRTAGFSNNPWVGQLSGLDRGFEEFVEWDLEITRSETAGIHTGGDRLYSPLHSLLGQAARQPVFLLKRRFFTANLVDRARRWIDRAVAGPEPTFTFMNLMEAHSPYFPPKSAFRALGLDPPGPVEPRVLNTKLLAYVLGKRDLDTEERERVMEYYDASLRYQDRKVGELLSTLRDRDALGDTLVVICADHGKTLGDYDRDETPPHYTRSINVNVPLVVKHPGQSRGRREDRPFELTALYDTVLRAVDGARTADDPHGGVGTGEVALVEDFLPHAGRTAPEEIDRWRVLVDGEYRYVSDGRREFLFDVREGRDDRIEDPDPSLLASYRTAMEERTDALGDPSEASDTRELDGAVRSQLHDLGYM